MSDFDGSMSSEKPETWQTWSIQRASFSDSEFEGSLCRNLSSRFGIVDKTPQFSLTICAAAEISFIDNQIPEGKGASDDESTAMTELSAEALNKPDGISSNEIRTRLHHLELELTSALCVLRSKSVEHVPKKVPRMSI